MEPNVLASELFAKLNSRDREPCIIQIIGGRSCCLEDLFDLVSGPPMSSRRSRIKAPSVRSQNGMGPGNIVHGLSDDIEGRLLWMLYTRK